MTTDPPRFELETHYNDHLRRGGDTMRAVLRVRANVAADLRLRLEAPVQARVVSCERVGPEPCSLYAPTGPEAGEPGEPVPELPLGPWAPGDQRDYMLTLTVRPRDDHLRARAVRVSLVPGDSAEAWPEAEADITAVWTDRVTDAGRIDHVVACYDGQIDLAHALDDGLDALARDDAPAAAEHLGRAAELSDLHRNTETMAILARIVDTSSGNARLRPPDQRSDTVRIVLPPKRWRTAP